MSTIFDAAEITIDETTDVVLGSGSISTVDITLSQDVQTVEVTVDTEIATAVIEVPGPQGPAGLQNVYVQANDPAVEYGWGAEEAGFIWAQIVV